MERQREGNNSLRVGHGSQRFKPVPQAMIPTVLPMYRYPHHHKWREGGGGEGKRREGMGGGGVALRYATSPSEGSSLFDCFEAGLHYAEKRANV